MYHSTLCITVAKILKTIKLLYSSSVSLPLKWILLLLYSMFEVVKVCKFFFTTNLTNVDSMRSYSVVRRLFVCFHRWALWFFKNDKSKTWQANLRLISKFDTVEDFWAYVFDTCWVHATQYHRLKCKARIIVWMGFCFFVFWAKMLMIIPVCVFQWNSNWPIRWGEVACIHMLWSLYGKKHAHP